MLAQRCRKLLFILSKLKPTKPIKLTEADKVRFWKKVDQRGSDECWEWQACCNRRGYGIFKISGFVYYVNRVAYVITNGDTELQVLHNCDNPPCCNPAHLYLGTPKINSERRDAEGRNTHGERHANAKLTEADVCEIRRLRVGGWLLREIAQEFGIAESNVSMICSRKSWRHLS